MRNIFNTHERKKGGKTAAGARLHRPHSLKDWEQERESKAERTSHVKSQHNHHLDNI